MLDIQPNDKSIKNKNLIADESLKNAIKSRPNPLYKKEYANLNKIILIITFTRLTIKLWTKKIY